MDYHTTVPISEASASRKYFLLRNTQLFFAFQNAFSAPAADKYCADLFEKLPEAKKAVEGKLAVVTGVTIGGAGYHIAEELALAAGMTVIIMGRNATKLEKAIDAIKAEAEKRGLESPTLHSVIFDLNDLTTAVTAASEAMKIAKASFDSKLHVLVNNAGASVPEYKLTKQGVEANVGMNFLAPHLLTEKLIPALKAATTPSYKPRCVIVASLAHATSPDYDPALCLENPKDAGGHFKFDDDGKFAGSMLDLGFQYGCAKLADIASCHFLAKQEPSINFSCLHPGSIASNFGNSLGFIGTIYYRGFYLFQYSPSQGAATALRASLDPAFNTAESLQGAYLHADGNPWPKAALTINDPDTEKPYEGDKYSEKVVTLGNELIAKLL